jgi:glycosyltransferase involved in cell wall biosynthesis
MSQKLSDAEFTVAVAQWIYNEIRSSYPNLRPQQLIMAHHGVDTTKWKPCIDRPERTNNLISDTFRIVSVGRLHPAKGHDILIQSVHNLLNEGRRLELTVIGAGPARDALASLIDHLSLAESVHLAGSQSEDQIIRVMSESNAFVLASHNEPLGVVYMEAMAMGLPTIGTCAGGVPEIITQNVDGLLVPPNDIYALEQAIELLMDNSNLRRELSVNGRKKVVENFDSQIGAKVLYTRLYGSPPVLRKL